MTENPRTLAEARQFAAHSLAAQAPVWSGEWAKWAKSGAEALMQAPVASVGSSSDFAWDISGGGQGILVEAAFGSALPVPPLFSDQPALAGLEDRFTLLAARAEAGQVVQVERGARPQAALKICARPARNLALERSFWRIGAGAAIEIVAEYLGEAEAAASLTQIEVEAGASLRLVILQDFAKGCDFQPRYQIRLGARAQVELFYLGLGGQRSQLRACVELAGENAEFQAVNCVYGDNTQELDAVLAVRHQAPHTKSGATHWAVVADAARSTFNGLIHVEKQAAGSDAFQKSRALLLSRKAQVHSMPKLIIATDEVACQHGASVACVDQEQKFYLESRGLSPAQAVRAMVLGFAAPVIAAVPNAELRARLEERVGEKGIGDYEL